MPAPGQRAKLINTLDQHMADDLQALYSIEISVTKSPKSGVKCGAIVVFRLNQIDMDFASRLDPKRFDASVLEKAQEMQDDINKQTEVMHMDPIYFKETDGQWLPWAIDRALRLYDQYGGNASISLKCQKLRVKVKRSMKDVARLRSTPEALFPVVRDIDQLLSKDFTFDPWNQVIRRGEISAIKGKL
jgi:hypothetical protein